MVNAVAEGNFEAEVLKSERPVLVDFWAAWCGPCKMLAPVVSDIASAHPEYKVCKVNVDENQSLAMRYGVQSIPTVIAFKGGAEVKRSVGLAPKAKLLELLL